MNYCVSNSIERERTMLSENQAPIRKTTLWTGRIMSALPALFLLFDAIMKLVKPEAVVKATVDLGYPEGVILGLGIVLLSCTLHARSRFRREVASAAAAAGFPVHRQRVCCSRPHLR